MWFYSSTQNSDDAYKECQRNLGEGAELGVSYELFDAKGKSLKKGGFQDTLVMPMASIAKIGISLLIARRIQEKSLTREQQVIIMNNEISPGPLNNPLDSKFPDKKIDPPIQTTVIDLLTMMHEYSDNTAADALTKLLGNPTLITDFLHSIGIEDYFYTRESNELLGTYYDFPYAKNDADADAFEKQAADPGIVRPTEATMFTGNRDVCSPRSLTNLLQILLYPAMRPELLWLPVAAELVLTKMESCKTAAGLISAAVEPYKEQVEHQGYKSGFIGGIRNVMGYLEFHNGEKLAITICTRNSSIKEEADRAPIIAKLVSYIFEKELNLTPDHTPSLFSCVIS